MPSCPRCRRGRLAIDETRLVCLSCAFVARDDVTTVDRVLSNMTPEEDPGSGVRKPGDIAAALDRAMGWGAR